ncbi:MULTISPECIES: DUF6470 family protein [unclassified Fusibacter]|uniref:DUF6470 family protein n=1 Tax=unclassified Fusibacter TaxID=2624464 RepID=UPI00101141B9|nr:MULTISPECIES: DUF6470 family protein [unclassified Fusibacter]MCK8059837.1 DUF6470 family protein [Fusibacter sp. A2]NPE21639.1 hypothetical protein [Fusibacter sp. A1]RXV62043.1 hypothetical protein DWB64_07330 [Fusibacter sp. A1]
MAIGQVNISTTPAILSINRTRGQQTITQEQFTLDIQTEHPKVFIESTLPKVEIDQSRAFSEAGLKDVFELTRELAAYALNEMVASIGRIAEQGTQLTNVHSNPNAIADQAYYNAFEQFDSDWNIDFIPKSRPTITLIEGQNDIRVQEGHIINNTQKSKVEHQYTPSQVKIAMQSYNTIAFNYQSKVDKQV